MPGAECTGIEAHVATSIPNFLFSQRLCFVGEAVLSVVSGTLHMLGYDCMKGSVWWQTS